MNSTHGTRQHNTAQRVNQRLVTARNRIIRKTKKLKKNECGPQKETSCPFDLATTTNHIKQTHGCFLRQRTFNPRNEKQNKTIFLFVFFPLLPTLLHSSSLFYYIDNPCSKQRPLEFVEFSFREAKRREEKNENMSFQDIEAGVREPSRISSFNPRRKQQQNESQDPSQAVAAAVFQINTAVSSFYRLVNSLGTPKDTLELRDKLSVRCSFLCCCGFPFLFLLIDWFWSS